MVNILFVEDNRLYAETLLDYFQDDLLKIDLATNRESAIELFYRKIYDIFLVDICIPMEDGFRLIEEIRSCSNNPILALTSLNDSSHAMHAFALGCDDFIRKTCDMSEIKERIISKRLKQFASCSDSVDMGDGFRYCILCKTLYSGGEMIKITPFESAILSVLVERRNCYIAHDVLHRLIYPAGSGESSSLRFHIMSLRKKLGVDKIESTRGFGYKLIV